MVARRCQIRPCRRLPRRGVSAGLACLYWLSVARVALVATLRNAKRRNPDWSIRSAVRKRGGHLALPLEMLHAVLGKRRVHQLERFFSVLD